MLDNLRIRDKLILAFSALLLTVMASGVVSIIQLGSLRTQANDLAESWLPSIEYISDMQYRLTRSRMNEASYIAEEDAALRQDYSSKIAENRQAFQAAEAKYRKLIHSEQERRLYDDLMRAAADESRTSRQVMALAANGRVAEAEALFRTDGLARFRDTLTVIDNLIAMNREGGHTSAANASAAYETGRTMSLSAMFISATLSVLLLVMLVRKIAQPISGVTNAMDRMSQGDMTADADVGNRRDEVGMLAATMTRFRDQLVAADKDRQHHEQQAARAKEEQTAIIVGSIGNGLAALSQGDLTHRVTADLEGAFAKLKNDFNSMAERLEQSIGSSVHSADAIRVGSAEIAQAADDFSRRTEAQAASLEETAAALDQANATVRATAGNAKRAAERVEAAQTAAQEGGEVAGRAIATMGDVRSSSRQIADVLTLIENISLQTNLLALNAGVEAARAGDAGRGFAVVANEVRALAQRSSQAANEIKQIIAESTTQVDGAVDLVNRSGEALRRITEEVNGLSELSASVARASEEQASGLSQINTAVAEMNTATQQNAAMIEQTTAAARSLATEADNLAETTGFFKLNKAVRQSERQPRPAARQAKLVVVGSRHATAAAQDDDWSSF